jgi:hypothetical protein
VTQKGSARSKSTGHPRASGFTGIGTTPPITTTMAFYLDDFGRTLFPLKTNKEIIQKGETEVK